MTPTFIRPFFCTALLFGSAMLGESSEVASERPSIESVLEALKRANDAFFESQKLSLKYGAIATAANKTSAARSERVLGRDDASWCTERKTLNVPPGKKVASPATLILKNGMFLDWQKFNGSVVLVGQEVRNFNLLYGWEYLEHAGFNPYRPVVESTGMSFEEAMALDEKSLPRTGPGAGLLVLHHFMVAPFLPDFLEMNASKYSVAERSESIDGEACWAIEWPGMDKIWINVNRGYAVRRRVYHRKPAGPPARRVDNSDFREVKPGLWFCFRQTVDTYGDMGRDEADWDKVVNRTTYEVSECDFSRAPESLTALRLPVGTRVNDTIRKLQYTVSDEQGDPFEKPLGQAQEAVRATRRTGILGTVMIANAALVVLVALYIYWRRKKAAAIILVAVCNLAAGATADERMWHARDDTKMVDDKGEWLWKPAWLETNACGPNSLFVLLRLLGKDITLDQVKDLVKCHPVRGCSIADLSDAASALGVPADVRFVGPSELAAVPVPYIAHGISGLKAKTRHFVVVVERDHVSRNLATIDPMRESFTWNPERGFISDYSGYILVPRQHSVAASSALLGLGLTLISICLVWRSRTAGTPSMQCRPPIGQSV